MQHKIRYNLNNNLCDAHKPGIENNLLVQTTLCDGNARQSKPRIPMDRRDSIVIVYITQYTSFGKLITNCKMAGSPVLRH